MLGLAMLAALIPAIIAAGDSDSPTGSPAVIIPIQPADTNFLASCPAFAAGSSCSAALAQPPARETLADAEPVEPLIDPADTAAEPVAEPTPAPTPETEPMATLTVREGDTLFALAEWFGIGAGQLALANGMSLEDYLQIGQTLVIPIPESQFVMPPEPEIYAAAEEEEAAAAAVAAAAQATPPPPTPAPTPVPPPYIPPSGDEIVAIICSLPWPCETMVRIASCESGLNPRAMNPAGYYGLFQIAGIFPGWDDPLTNATVAYNQKYLPDLQRGGDGLAPWPVCRYY